MGECCTHLRNSHDSPAGITDDSELKSLTYGYLLWYDFHAKFHGNSDVVTMESDTEFSWIVSHSVRAPSTVSSLFYSL
jgi:hypothetical protein